MNKDIKFSRIPKPMCLVGECDGTGWIPTGDGQAIACRCQKLIEEFNAAGTMKKLLDDQIYRAFGIDPEELKGGKR